MKEFKVIKPYDCHLQNYPLTIPWDMLNEHAAYRNHHQTLCRLNERGGMNVYELLCNIKSKPLNFSSIETQRDVDELNQLIKDYKETL